jgi:uncharacterized coiled-coil protein SlyX
MAKGKSPAGTTRALVPLEKRLGRLRERQANKRRQLERLNAKVNETATQMSRTLAAVSAWVEDGRPVSGVSATVRSSAPGGQAPRTGIRRLIGA